MNGKIAVKTVILSFCITWVFSGCVLIANQFGYLKYGTPLTWVFISTGALAPAIAAFIILMKNKVMPAKQFFRIVFALKQPVRMYFLVLLFVVIYFSIGVLTGLFEYDSFDYISLAAIPLMIIGGGLEEVGWRFVLNPALEKKLPFAVACSVTAVIWSVWHLPIFFIEGSSQNTMNFFIFSIGSLGLSFAYAAIYRISRSVWLCVFIHALNNSLYDSFVMKVDRFDTAVIPVTITAAVMIIVSILTVINIEKIRNKNNNVRLPIA
jgi:membrane protease YdiL (CAAX protease family)